MKILKVFLGLISTMAVVFAVGMYGYYKGWHIDKFEVARLTLQLQPGYEIFAPTGAGPFPTVIGFHGCTGILEGNRDWARFLQSLHYAVVLVDSMDVRELDWPTVCAGKALWGSERAGDVIAALHDVRQMEFVDPRQIILMGWSHGAWTVMDMLALLSANDAPTNLSRVPPGTLDGVIGSVLFYPFCEFPSLSGDGWSQDVSTYFVFAENDSVVANEACFDIVGRLQADHRPVSSYTYPNIDHAFDMRTSDFYEGTLQNVPDATLDARQRVAKYLQALHASP